jgi:hypothetical protein
MTYSAATMAYADAHCRNAGHYRGRTDMQCGVADAYDAGHAAAVASDAGLVEDVQPRELTTAAELDALAPEQYVVSRMKCFCKQWDHMFMRLSSKELFTAVDLIARYGPLTLLVPAAAVPAEPERLTDPDDPRIKPGARVRLEIDYDVVDDAERAYQYQEDSLRTRLRNPTVATTPDHEHWLLLAEAPDPDADVEAALARILDSLTPREALAALRRGGCDAVSADA